MTFLELLQWQYLIFVLPFVAALMYVMLMVFAGISVDQDIDHDIGGGGDVDHGFEHDHEFDHDIEPSMLMRALSVLGVGRVPISVIVMCLCFIWGFTGWMANVILSPVFPVGMYVWISGFAAFICSILLTRIIAVGVSNIMPSTETYGTKSKDLVGQIAVTDSTVDDTFGQATLTDDYGNLQRVSCRTKKNTEPIPRDTQVVLMFYDTESETFLVDTDLPIDVTKE